MSSIPSTEPFLSLVALRAAHTALLRRHRSEGETPDLIAAADKFLAHGRATGALLAEDDERWTAQSLLDYWSATLYRAGTAAPDATLDPFDPALAPALPDDACPFLGLDAFREENAALFFGRRQVVSDLLNLLRAKRLAAVVGPSGSGKSSLVRAGLIPLLRNGGISDAHGWRIVTFVPGSQPQQALERALASAPAGDTSLLLIDQFE